MDDPGVIAIIRLSGKPPVELLAALARGGVEHVEITLTTPGCLEAVAEWRVQDPQMVVGVGSVRSPDDVRAAANAGAQFLVTPSSDPAVLRTAGQLHLAVASGASTPGEIVNAMTWGATWVKVFPVDLLGGPDYIRAVRAPLPDLPLLPTGGVHPASTREYAALGCRGIGAGSALVSQGDVDAARWTRVEQLAAAFTSAWTSGVHSRA